MTAEITVSQLYWNPSLMNFFFRSQAKKTFNEVMDRIALRDKQLAFDYFETQFSDVDEFEEYLYNGDIDEIIDELEDYGVDVIESYDDED